MTFTVTVLVLTLIAAVWLACELLRPGIRAWFGGGPEDGDSKGTAAYAPVSRLLAEADFAYLADEEDLVARLREARSATLRLYLKRIRRDYLEVWQICKLLAPISPDPAFAAGLTKQYWAFHWAYAGLLARCVLPALLRGNGMAADRLVDILTEIRTQAQALLAVSEAAMSASAAA